jgi:hypothetical protein
MRGAIRYLPEANMGGVFKPDNIGYKNGHSAKEVLQLKHSYASNPLQAYLCKYDINISLVPTKTIQITVSHFDSEFKTSKIYDCLVIPICWCYLFKELKQKYNRPNLPSVTLSWTYHGKVL